ncbi:hypothetical protein QCA50_015519 [Cerrena zonata]|uniref:Uncharacterized protein n=1 Tax=Cerrena zonata TaxID=2478898 RepID=A0AAW0FMP1_9APHY
MPKTITWFNSLLTTLSTTNESLEIDLVNFSYDPVGCTSIEKAVLDISNGGKVSNLTVNLPEDCTDYKKLFPQTYQLVTFLNNYEGLKFTQHWQAESSKDLPDEMTF